MPTASLARLEKQASLDANDPLKQGIVIIEHKIRNLEKRKTRLDGYRDLQKSGKDLNSDQLEAVAKYDAVLAHLDFARELSKQLSALAVESAKTIKKQARKEAAEKAQQDLARTKEILIINDLLSNMGLQHVRDDLMGGKAKVTLTEAELQSIDDLYEELTPKKDEPAKFVDMFQTPAETLHCLVEAKPKKAFGTTCAALKTKLMEIATSGYFDTIPPAAEPEPAPADVAAAPVVDTAAAPTPTEEPLVQPVQVIQPEIPIQPAVSHTYQPSKGQPMAPINPADVDSSIVTAIPAQPIAGHPQGYDESAYYPPAHLRVLQTATIDFMQDNEIDQPEAVEAPSAIPTMTFANQSFPPAEPPTIPPAATHRIEIQEPYQNRTDEEKSWATSGPEPAADQAQPAPAVQQPVSPWTSLPSDPPPPQNLGGGDDEWASQTEQWSQNSAAANDGFITAGSGRGRGGRGRNGGGAGGDRNNKGGYGGGGSNRGPRSSQGGGRGGYRGGERGEGGFNHRDRDGQGGGGSGYYRDQNSSGGGGYQNGYRSERSERPGGGPSRQPQQGRPSGASGRGGGSRGRGGQGGGYRGGGSSSNYSGTRQ
ncbi:Cell cycle associated protein 1 [Nesidiocoris tenuis]|uniref:Cell cycle associated protein 1 n=2 Tax=Nesidiocoris tenuis TaxID=355587 RepID=A0ABN7BCL2_9HEMI|nr:Cell cycle associated protein 1 [Nesidiocoris tenuis]